MASSVDRGSAAVSDVRSGAGSGASAIGRWYCDAGVRNDLADRLAGDARPRDAADVQRDREHPGRPRTRPAPRCPTADILVIDDGSPDGTADQAEKLGEVLGGIDVLRRAAEVGPRLRVPRRVPRRSRAGLRRHDRDGRRPLARPRGAARARRRGRARRRPRHRVPLRARRVDPRLEVGAPGDLALAAVSTPAPCSGSRCTTPPPASVRTTATTSRGSTSTACGPTATASRWR